MRRLTENEIRFIKETGITATVIQCDEWDRSTCSNYADAEKLADAEYGINLQEFLRVLADVHYDSISLDYDAVYLLYTFLTREELENMNHYISGLIKKNDLTLKYNYFKQKKEGLFFP